MRPAFITGATGFVGGAILDHLVGSGREVRALVRRDEDAAALASRGAVPVIGDVLDEVRLVGAMAGIETVFHVAGVNAFCLPDPAPMFRTNVEGSRAVVRAAARAGVARVVYTSSAAAIGEPAGVVATEESRHRGFFLSEYERSKYAAERAVFEAARGVEVVAVNPSSVQGPGRTGGTARLILGFLNGTLRAALDSRVSLVDVDDCARGHVLAEERGVAGERYLLNGSTLLIEQALDLLAGITGLAGRPVVLPARVVELVGAGAGGIFGMLKRRAPLCPEMVRSLLHGHAYDGSRATRDLGLTYTPIAETLHRTVAWYVANGYVRRTLPAFVTGD